MEIRPDDSKELRECNSAEDTILDILNADCWRLILNYVSINDIVRSERVSRAWQSVVWNYLAGVHNYRIENLYYYKHKIRIMSYWNYRSIRHQGRGNSFEQIIQKMGSGFVKIVANCIDEGNLRAIALHCPNLEALTFYRTFRNIPLDNVKKLKQLKQIAFDSCAFREDHLRKMITSETVEELKIENSRHVTGRFLTSLKKPTLRKKHLKCLALNACDFLLFKYIQSTEDYLTKLTRLELNDNSSEIVQNVHLLLDKTPCLEHLSLVLYRKTDLGEELPTAIGRLSRLEGVYLQGNQNVTDEWLATLGRGCPALRIVDVGYCWNVSPRGVVALCRARPLLTELSVAGLDVTDEDLEACARCCRGLRWLDVCSCTRLTRRLPERIAGPLARLLRLQLGL